MYEAIVFLPLLGGLIAGLFGRLIGARACEVITTALLFASMVLAWIAFVEVGLLHHDARVPLTSWMISGDLKIDWSLRVDTLTVVMFIVVTTVSAFVHLYSIGYMHEDPHRERFFSYISLFTFAMLMLVTADNVVQLFFGWEGVGLMSYLLIGFWYQKPSANAAAIKAFIVNRVGDFGFLLGIFALFMMAGALDLDTIFAQAPTIAKQSITFFGLHFDAMTLICFFLFMGAMGKSAQIFLHTWLPDAMEGPTPVSALIHAATMVTAGVFMVARLSPLFDLAPNIQTFITFIGGTTAFFAATIGCVQNDIKRVIAYSTCSQLGYMFTAMGVGAYSIGMWHLMAHACFKGLLFLCAGSVIHATNDDHDMRHMGGLRHKMPITFYTMVIGGLALTGFPLTAGFFSKDAIIHAAYYGANPAAMYGWFMTLVAAGLTTLYTWRLLFMTFFGEPRDKHLYDHAHESPWTMLVPLCVLAFGAFAAGYPFISLFEGKDVQWFFGNSITFTLENPILEAMHHMSFGVEWSPTLVMLIGLGIAWYYYIHRPDLPAKLAEQHQVLYKFLLNKWYFDEIYDIIFVRPYFWLGRVLWKGGDGYVIDGFGPDGVSARVLDVTRGVVRIQTGYLYHYAFAMLIGVAALITWFMFAGGMP